MECIFCKGDMKKATAPFHVDRNGYHVTFDNVPAWLCMQCGEPYFEESQVEGIQKAIKDIDKNTAQLHSAA